MADDIKDNKVISKKNSGFPEYLDFDKLRSEGIGHLGKLSGKIWTDHNVHDPGITILEVLCYALLDLGYRTNLPVKDIFARDPNNKTKDDNFLTPSEILTCNPLTITDFRKLLIDIDGVKNAWLEIATDINAEDYCFPKDIIEKTQISHGTSDGPQAAPQPTTEPECCVSYLNGLYHVYLDLERQFDENSKTDTDQKNEIIKKVKKALLAHRNICEDFVDIKVLCKWKIGVCAEIELDADVDPEKTYVDVAEKLREFFSPSPRFYTLSQLLDKQKTIDEIYAGRPYNITESHGFVDTTEFEALSLRRSIHVSDVYDALFKVEGVRRVQTLSFRKCNGDPLKPSNGSIQIPFDNIPEFSIECSGFKFIQQGKVVAIDFKKYEEVLKLNFEHNGKVLYKTPSLYLDTEIPKGIYRDDLGAYYSIQNEFPRVYGIANGELPADASPKRIAQSLQLKSYLLFFDQLLANYLSQLQNVRSLFNLSFGGKTTERPTYFYNQPDSVPDLQKLVNYKTDAKDETGNRSLVIPVNKKLFDGKTTKDLLCLDIEKLEPYAFANSVERDIAIKQVQEDIYGGLVTAEFITKGDECVFYYVVTSSEEYVLITNGYFENTEKAKTAFEALKYAGSTASNYYPFTDKAGLSYSFDIRQGKSTYTDFIKRLVEDPTLNLQRRQSFLDHLLARFAEQFTDFSLLSFRFYDGDELKTKDIHAKQFFLSNYSQLSSQRGKALDYSLNGWTSENISGFEKRFKALTGSENLSRQSLCNFEVYEYSKKYVFNLSLAGVPMFESDTKYESAEEAKDGLKRLLEAMGESNYTVKEDPVDKTAMIHLPFGKREEAVFNGIYTKDVAYDVVKNLQNIFSPDIINGEVLPASYKYSALLYDNTNTPVRNQLKTYSSKKEAKTAAIKSIGKINEDNVWKPGSEKIPSIEELIHDESDEASLRFIDLKKFLITPDYSVGKPGVFFYEILDKDQYRFKFKTLAQFDNENKEQADPYVRRLLFQMTNIDNYKVEKAKEGGGWGIYITKGEEELAFASFGSEKEAEEKKKEIFDIVDQYTYHAQIDEKGDTWRFEYNVGYEPGKQYRLKSEKIYTDDKEAEKALTSFSDRISQVVVEKQKNNELLVKAGKKDAVAAKLHHIAAAEKKESVQPAIEADKLLSIEKEFRMLYSKRNESSELEKHVRPDKNSTLPYVYHLVDKDNILARYTGETRGDVAGARKNVIQREIKDYNIPDLYLGPNAVVERIGDDGKTKWYHYQLRTINYILRPGGGLSEKLVLFESTKGYATKEEAEKAFTENYLIILGHGLCEENYGDKKFISETKLRFQDTHLCSKTESVVFIPRTTLDFLRTYPGGSMDNLIRIVKGYPIRLGKKTTKCDNSTDKSCVQYTSAFWPCDKPDPDEECSCTTKDNPYVYFFALYDKSENKDHWESIRYYESPAEGMKAFHFFLLLLRYEGNYYLDCDCHGEKSIYIREVLAESVDFFATPALAWAGVERFINVSQTNESFYAYTDGNCCNKFFVACKNIKAVHPCKYDTERQRDIASEILSVLAPELKAWDLSFFCNRTINDDFVNFDNVAIAKYKTKGFEFDSNASYLDIYIDLIGYINNFCLCIDEKEKKVYVPIGEEESIYFTPIGPDDLDSLKSLKEKLAWNSCYFPFTKKQNQEQTCYGIEIRIPRFNGCECEKDSPGYELCPVAWISECCYWSCVDVINGFKIIVDMLQKKEWYNKVFDCVCGSYGIVLQGENPQIMTANTVGTKTVSGIIARTPQCYTSNEMVCDAIQRAKRLINVEGLHLVEHILLRPHCIPECEWILKPCNKADDPFDNCKFEWQDADEDDPCEENKKPVCFKPGADPYSFIATVALPVWSEKFRSNESRELIERILYREMPAHVLLRVLWLTPHDLCCFEKHFKQWLNWTAYKTYCGDSYSTKGFVKFLFDRSFECMDEIACEECVPASSSKSDCFIDVPEKDYKCLRDWSEQVSDIYCWKKCDCSENNFVDCSDEHPAVTDHTHPVADEHEAIANEMVGGAAATTLARGIIGYEMSAAATPRAAAMLPTMEKAKFVNGRLMSYRKPVEKMLTSAKGRTKDFLEKVRSYLKLNKVTSKDYQGTIAEILRFNEQVKNGKTKLVKKDLQELIENVTKYFFDKNLFNGKDREAITQSHASFGDIKKYGVNLAKLYEKWDPAAVKTYQPDIQLEEMEKIFLPEK